MDIVPEELHNSVQSSVALAGDVGAVLKQLMEESRSTSLRYDDKLEWWSALKSKCEANKKFNLVI